MILLISLGLEITQDINHKLGRSLLGHVSDFLLFNLPTRGEKRNHRRERRLKVLGYIAALEPWKVRHCLLRAYDLVDDGSGVNIQ